MILRAVPRRTTTFLTAISRRRFMPTINNIADVRQALPVLLKDPTFEPICWVGLFGSISRSTHSDASDIDLIVGYKDLTDDVYSIVGNFNAAAEEGFDRPVETLHLINPKARAYLLLDALLTSVTVYGSDEWPRGLRESNRKYLDDGYLRLKEAHRLLEEIEQLVAKVTKEVPFTAYLI